jgi:hypothetical protein
MSKRSASGSHGSDATLSMRAGVPAMVRNENPLLHFRCRHLRNEVELVVGRSAVRVILGLITLALGVALALTGSENAKQIVELIGRLPIF